MSAYHARRMRGSKNRTLERFLDRLTFKSAIAAAQGFDPRFMAIMDGRSLLEIVPSNYGRGVVIYFTRKPE